MKILGDGWLAINSLQVYSYSLCSNFNVLLIITGATFLLNHLQQCCIWLIERGATIRLKKSRSHSRLLCSRVMEFLDLEWSSLPKIGDSECILEDHGIKRFWTFWIAEDVNVRDMTAKSSSSPTQLLHPHHPSRSAYSSPPKNDSNGTDNRKRPCVC